MDGITPLSNPAVNIVAGLLLGVGLVSVVVSGSLLGRIAYVVVLTLRLRHSGVVAPLHPRVRDAPFLLLWFVVGFLVLSGSMAYIVFFGFVADAYHLLQPL